MCPGIESTLSNRNAICRNLTNTGSNEFGWSSYPVSERNTSYVNIATGQTEHSYYRDNPGRIKAFCK